ncbi:MAG TPA: hypothetical protein PKC43_11125 [Phycisphaerales bacterium]|nr:hypothetical protein [Phycisphaerales bacterium]HMP37985.1 hypothetical protein [Phycisphaerales bacterium]
MSARSARRRRGGVLLETLVAVAIFVAAAGLLLRLSTDALSALDRAERRSAAVDLARSALARLESGAINLADLRAGRVDAERSGRDEPAGDAARFRVSVATRRSPHPGLTVVEIEIRDRADPADASPLVSLRQLVELRRDDGDAGPGAEAARAEEG